MENYLNQFENPSSDFRGAPFWAWNCKLDKDTLLNQVDYFKQMGMGGFTIHCRTGLDTEYMGDEFMDIVKDIVEKAKSLNMKVCLYDEDRWPSGYGGGRITKDLKNRNRYLVFTSEKRQDGNLIAKYEIILKDGYLTHYKKLSKDAPEDTNKDIRYAYLEIGGNTPWFNNQSYVNTLDKNAIDCFINNTYEKYKDVVGDEFGKTIPSIFTDEPQFTLKQTLGRADDKSAIVIPYTDDFETTYYNHYNESFLDKLPEIIWELPENKISTTRYRYHDHITERFSEAFSDNIGNWCDKNNIKLTGHLLLEDNLHSQTIAIGEAMRHYRGFQIPGIDMLCDWREYSTAKQAQSVAHQMGRNKITSELYGVTNWDFDFRGHKLQGDWQAALGITERVHHLSWVSMEGEAKRDYPASIFYQSPWYKKYEVIESYFARINTALQTGEPLVRIGVIHPIESYWLYFGPDEQTYDIREKLQNNFEQITNWLLFGNLDYDFISESLLETTGFIYDKSFGVGKMKYDVIIVPGCKTLRSTTLYYLRAFVNNGGRVIFMGEIPELVNAVPDLSVKHLAENAECIEYNCKAIMNSLQDIRLVDIRNNRGIRSDRHLYQMRKIGDDRILFIANGKKADNMDNPISNSFSISVTGIFTPVLLDPMTGKKTKCDYKHENGKTVIETEIFEYDSLLFYLSKSEQSGVLPSVKNKQSIDIITLNNVDDFELSEPNVMMLDQAEYSLDNEEYRASEEVLRIDNILRRQLGYPLKMEALAQPWVEDNSDTDKHILKLKYTVNADIDLDNVKLAIERPELCEVTLNGNSINMVPDGWYTDKIIKTIPINGIKKGSNELIITMLYSSKTNLEWNYLLGDFGVYQYGNKSKLTNKQTQLGFSDLTTQSFPFYGGNITYICNVNLPNGDYELEVAKFRAPLLSVSVDDIQVGNIFISPYRVSLGNLSGAHTIKTTAYGSRINTFGPVHICDENIDWFGPNAWRTEGDQFSYEYQLKKTGILAAPKLHKIN